MLTIKFNAIDIDGKIVYCYFRDIKDNPKSPAVERTFSYDRFIEREPELAKLLEGDIYSLYLEDNYTEKKSVDGTYCQLNEEEITYIKSLVKKACVDIEYDDLLRPPSIDDQIDSFIKEFFDEQDEPAQQKDFLAEFFKEIEQKQE